MIKGIIFDLDGVIVSTDDYHYQAWKKIAEQEGIYFDRKINNRLRGVSRKESLEIILEKANREYDVLEKENLLIKKNQEYVNSLSTLSKENILPGINELISYLKVHNYHIAIGSSSKNAKIILEKIGLRDMFDIIVDGWDVKNSKPAPDLFLLAAYRLNISPFECAVIEDAVAGIKAAKAAKMLAIAINFKNDCQLADLNIKHPKEIIQYLEANNYEELRTFTN